MMKPCKGLGARLRELREEIGWSQREAAEICGLARKSMIRLESEISNPAADELLALADLYEVSVDYLLGRTDDRGAYGRKPQVIERIIKVEAPRRFFNPAWEEEREE